MVIRELIVAVAAFAGYVAVLAWETWPLAARLTTHLNQVTAVATRDVPYITWVLAWQSHALATDPTTILDANIYWPARQTLFYGDPGFGALPYFAPVFLTTGNPTLAINCLFLGGIALTALSLHLVVRRWCGSHAAGIVAAATLLTNPWAFRFFSWAPSYTVLFYLPWIMYLAATRTLRLRDAFWLAPLLVLQCLTNAAYVAPATLVPLGVLAVARLVRPHARRGALALALSVTLAVVGLAPIYAGYLRTRQANVDIQAQKLAEEAAPNPEMEKVVKVVGRVARAVVSVPRRSIAKPQSTGATLVTLLIVAAGALCAMRSSAGWRNAWAHGALWTAMGFVLSIPAVSFFGGPVIVSPVYALIGGALPAVDQVIRAPDRLGLISVVGWAVLAGVAFAACAAHIGRRVTPLLLVAVLSGLYVQLRPHMPANYPLVRAVGGDSVVTRALREGRGPVLELPLLHDGTQFITHARAMYRSIFHWRPLLNGYSSYWPDGFRERMAVAARVPDVEALETLRRETRLTYVVVSLHALAPEARARWERIAAGERRDLRLVVRSFNELLFAVEPSG